MNLRFLETAKAEFWEAAAYYEREQEGLGGAFAREISKALDRIVDHPHAWRPLSPRTRQCRTHRIPYAVVYQVNSDHLLVVAIMHLWENPLANAQFTRLTNFEGDELAAAISRDGKFVAFLSNRDGPMDAFVTQVGSGSFTNLTHGKEALLTTPVRPLGFSPNGFEIWLGGSKDVSRLRLMPLMGGTPRAFLNDHIVNINWSPDGNQVAYHTFDAGDPTFVADRSGLNSKQLFVNPNPGGHAHFPTFSPDGRWIYFVTGIPSTNEMDLYRIRASGGQPEQLTHHNNMVVFPTPINDQSCPRQIIQTEYRKTAERICLLRYTPTL